VYVDDVAFTLRKAGGVQRIFEALVAFVEKSLTLKTQPISNLALAQSLKYLGTAVAG
jgi:hypothetical protein